MASRSALMASPFAAELGFVFGCKVTLVLVGRAFCRGTRPKWARHPNLRKRPGGASRSPVGHRLYAESEDAGCMVGRGNYRHGYFVVR